MPRASSVQAGDRRVFRAAWARERYGEGLTVERVQRVLVDSRFGWVNVYADATTDNGTRIQWPVAQLRNMTRPDMNQATTHC